LDKNFRLDFSRRVVYRLRQNIFDSIVKQEVAFFDITRTGELTNRLSSDTQVLQNAVTVNISMLLRFILQILGSLIVMFYLEVTLTLILMVVVPVIVLIAKQYGGVVRKLRKKFQDELAAAGTTAEESISNIRKYRLNFFRLILIEVCCLFLRNCSYLWCGIES
jgi:ABC-type multidrug transport system fused ATPase/permease subunit